MRGCRRGILAHALPLPQEIADTRHDMDDLDEDKRVARRLEPAFAGVGDEVVDAAVLLEDEHGEAPIDAVELGGQLGPQRGAPRPTPAWQP